MTALDEFTTAVWQNPSIQKIIARAMSRPDWPTFKFTDEMVRDSKPLWDWAEWLVDQYVGSFELMLDLRRKQRTGAQLREGQLRTALNVLLNCWRKSLQETKAAQPKPVFVKVEQQSIFDQPVDLRELPTSPIQQRELNPELIKRADLRQQSHNGADLRVAAWETRSPGEVAQASAKVQTPPTGTYTFVDEAGDYRVVKFTKAGGGEAINIAVQYGPDNVHDFARCGQIKPDGSLVLWGTWFLKGEKVKSVDHTQRADLRRAIEFICSMDKDGQLKAGEAYALKSKRCFRCGKELTVVSSISEGMGPICAGRW